MRNWKAIPDPRTDKQKWIATLKDSIKDFHAKQQHPCPCFESYENEDLEIEELENWIEELQYGV